MADMSQPDDPKLTAAVDMLGRTGATSFRVGYSDPDDGEPTVWYACATYKRGAEAAAALDPVTATLRLCEQVVDGGTCTHCGQPTIFDGADPSGHPVDELLDAMGCRYAWDPELKTFRRSCENGTRDDGP